MNRITTTLLAGAAVAGFSATGAVAAAPGARPGDTTITPPNVTTTHHAALKGKKCKIEGDYTAIVGQSVTMTTSKKGTYSATYCAAPWNMRVTSHTSTGFTVSMTYTGSGGCQDFTEDLTWDGCDEASGTFTDVNGGTGQTEWTRNTAHKVK